jgi:hypothetical protein
MGKEFWARRMASRLASRQTPPAMLPDQAIAAAAGVFWALFDDATTEANNALEHAGLQARIGVQRQPNERTYYLDSAGSTPRHIKIAINLRVADGQIHGGALLALSQTGAHVFLVPSFRDEEVQWLVRAVGTPLRAYIVRDLFLSIFADDPAATHRLSPLSGNDFFANPWL